MKVEGQIVTWNEARGFGFANFTDEKGRRISVFCHISQFPTKDVVPAIGTTLRFDVESTKKGPMALNIEVESEPMRLSSETGDADVHA